jgi:rRNA maturation endonuclease Nob1
MADEPTTDTVTDEPTDAAPEELGDAGKKALTEERAARKEAERLLKEATTKASRADELEAELAKFREDAMSDTEKAIEQARKEARDEGRNEALTQANERLFKAEVKAASAGKIIDSDLLSDVLVAQRLLGLDTIPTTSDGDIDGAAIVSAVDAMLESKPHLAVSATRTPGSADQGARPAGSPTPPTSLEDAFAVHYNK